MKESEKKPYSEFRDHGYRVTTPRKEILEILRNTARHMSVEDIYLELRNKGKSVGLTTIYRAVYNLTNSGVLRKFDVNNERAYYEIADENISGHHHHLICRSCNRIFDYSDFVDEEVALIRKLEKIVSDVHKFKVEDHQIAFTGLCELCK